MADESPKPELSAVPADIEAKFREYRAERKRQYDEALARLEDPDFEPEHRRAYEATLGEMLALPLNEIAWPNDEPRFRLHRALEYADQLTARRAEIEVRFEGRLPPVEVYSIGRYALAALHAFKEWRRNPEPQGSFGSVLKEAAQRRSQLRAVTSCFLAHDKVVLAELRNYDGGITPESIACDLFLLSGILQNLPADLKERMMATPLHLMEATLVARELLQHATRNGSSAELWQPLALYARALTLTDRASYEAEIVLSEFHNEERDPSLAGEWQPECLFCSCEVERQRHHRHAESQQATQRRAQFVSSTMTAALRRPIVEN